MCLYTRCASKQDGLLFLYRKISFVKLWKSDFKSNFLNPCLHNPCYILCRHGLGKQCVIPIQEFTFGTLLRLNFGTLLSLCHPNFSLSTLNLSSIKRKEGRKKIWARYGLGIFEVVREGLWD